jgi:hypothetical protein
MNETTTPTTTRKKLPRYDTRSRPGGETWTSPLPPRLMDALAAADVPEVAKHRELAGHFQKLRTKTIEIAGQLQMTRRDDERTRADALSSGKPRPTPRSEKIELDLKVAREDLALLENLLRSSADALLVAAVAFVEDALAAAERDAGAAIEQVRELLAATNVAVEEADKRSGEAGWLASFARSGIVWPWTDAVRAISLPRTRQHIRAAAGTFPDDVQRVADLRAGREREETEALALPPGAQVWKGAESYVVAPDGSLEGVER